MTETPHLKLIRNCTSNHGTEGRIWHSEGFICCTMELPWRDNQSNISCIPLGDYWVEPWSSKRFGNVYHVCDVPGRTYILLHAGNLAGDASMGFKTHSAGCILPGKYHGVYDKQRAVMCSRPAVTKLRNLIGKKEFRFTVENRP